MYADFISIADLSADELLELLELADELKKKAKAGEDHRPLAGKTLGMLFEKPSLRTRVTFEAGMYQLGGHAVFMQTTLGERETVPDIARNLERWVDAIVEVRAKGLMIGVEMTKFVTPLIGVMLDAGIVCGPAGPKVLRFLPALIVTNDQVDRVLSALDRALSTF